ncbi:hypothetical protein EVAR_32966_1 [Eumeta japonica]|uniref:Uncharacterized protein n=1 Tax=Eumeta variegata TaxID=151549 RepID=A0A4C1X055_EUMVA|nr:hypothetical protein EVAR_32966_1 [Eumeta japonica]
MKYAEKLKIPFENDALTTWSSIHPGHNMPESPYWFWNVIGSITLIEMLLKEAPDAASKKVTFTSESVAPLQAPVLPNFGTSLENNCTVQVAVALRWAAISANDIYAFVAQA